MSTAQQRKVVTREFDGGVEVTTAELDFLTSADMLPELTAIVAPGMGAAAGDGTLGDAIGSMAKALSGGKLVQLLPRLFAGTIVVAPGEDGKPVKYDLSNRNKINECFTSRKALSVKVARMVLEVNFLDFFEGLDLTDLAQPAPQG